MATPCILKPTALQFIPRPSPSVTKPINDNRSYHSPLLRNKRRKTTNINIEGIWKHYKSIYQQKRLESLYQCNKSIPQPIWNIILEFEYSHKESYIMFTTYIYKQIKKLHFIPWIIGFIQMSINAFVLSQMYDTVLPNSSPSPAPTPAPSHGPHGPDDPHSSMHTFGPSSLKAVVLFYCGIILFIASGIQLIGALITLCYIYHKSNYNIHTLATLKGCMFLNGNARKYIFNENNGWELFIEFEKWCNVLYVTDLMDKNMVIKGRIFRSDIIWMYLCKPVYCLIYGFFLIMQSIEIVMWIWIPLIIILWYNGLQTFLRIGSGSALFVCFGIGAMSYCAGVYFYDIIMDSITFNEAIILTMFVNAGIVGGVALAAIICLKYKPIVNKVKKYLYIHWIIISVIFTCSYMIEFGINFMYESEYQYTIWLCSLRLFGMYFWYLSFNLGIVLCGNVGKYKNFDEKRFMYCCWLLGWFDLHCINHVFHKKKQIIYDFSF